jgi:hypothetical protein
MVIRRRTFGLAVLWGSAVLLSSCGKSNPAGPVAVVPTPSPTAEPTPVPCGPPLPPPISKMRAVIHLKTGDFWTLDSTPIVVDREYCASIGFTDGRRECPPRPEGHPERYSCDVLAVGKAADTGRAGPTWRRNGTLCTGIASGCENEPDTQFQVRVYWQGDGEYTACAENGVCGTVFARGPL